MHNLQCQLQSSQPSHHIAAAETVNLSCRCSIVPMNCKHIDDIKAFCHCPESAGQLRDASQTNCSVVSRLKLVHAKRLIKTGLSRGVADLETPKDVMQRNCFVKLNRVVMVILHYTEMLYKVLATMLYNMLKTSRPGANFVAQQVRCW